MYMYQSVLVHQAETYHHLSGQEDTMLRVLSSAGSDIGRYSVIHEPQGDSAAYLVQRTGVWPALLGRLRRVAAALPAGARRWATSS
jgi:hypothetical protein